MASNLGFLSYTRQPLTQSGVLFHVIHCGCCCPFVLEFSLNGTLGGGGAGGCVWGG